MAEVPKQIAELIAKFDQNLDAYHTAAYGETEAPVEFINPFFEALPAYQLRRYAWSAKLPLSILTNFETLAGAA